MLVPRFTLRGVEPISGCSNIMVGISVTTKPTETKLPNFLEPFVHALAVFSVPQP